MSTLRRVLAPAALCALALTGVLIAVPGLPSGSAIAQSGTTSLGDVLAQLRRNAKVSERLNAGFFRAPQTRQYVGSAFNPTDSDTAYSADRGDSSLSLDATRPGTDVEAPPAGTTGVVGRTVAVPQTTGTFELPLDVPNRAEVVSVSASYRDAAGGNTTTDGTQAPSGLGFSLVRLGQLGESPEELLAVPASSLSSLGVRSQDGRAGTFALPLRNNAFRVDNSRSRYVLRVRLDDVNPDTRFYGVTLQYVIGRNVPGAPQTQAGS